MPRLTTPLIAETWYRVARLHRGLAALGHPVAAAEVTERRVGPSTRKQWLAAGIVAARSRGKGARPGTEPGPRTAPTPSPVPKAGELPAAGLDAALEQGGLSVASRSFTVAGTVRTAAGAPCPRQRLLAFDLDLRAVAVYRDARRLADLQDAPGFEFLGEATADRAGRYEITFFEWQYARAERKQADVVVYAVVDGPRDERIIAHSRLVVAEDYAESGRVDGLEVVVPGRDEQTEYAALRALLDPFLEESDLALAQIAASPEQLAFAARELDLDLSHLTIAAQAVALVAPGKRGLSPELLYGVGRQGIALQWPVLARQSERQLESAILRSSTTHIIQACSDKEVAAFVRQLLAVATGGLLSHAPAGRPSLAARLSLALPEEALRTGFIAAARSYTGTDPRDFWQKHLPAHPEFRDRPEVIHALLLTQQLTLLTGDHLPLVTALQRDREIGHLEELVDLTAEEWHAAIRESGVPEFVEGADEEARVAAYARALQSQVDAAFPTRRIARMVDQRALPIERATVERALLAFFDQERTFDIATHRVSDFAGQLEAIAGDEAPDVTRELQRIQRVYQVSPSPEAVGGLLAAGLDSAHAIASVPRESFIRMHADRLGGTEAAFITHQRAEHVAARAERITLRLAEMAQGELPHLILAPEQHQAELLLLQKEIPNFTDLFGRPDLCECRSCRSIYSPAAYLVDLLRFLWRCPVNDDGASPFDRLTARRPDLLHLPLTCENSNTLVPYIDLVNEIMEHYTVHDSLAAFAGFDTGSATVAELRAAPQHIDLDAYRLLAEARYPFTLPYHQPLDVIRRHGEHLGTSRYQVMRAVNPVPDPTTRQAMAAEALALSPMEHQVLTGTDFAGVAGVASVAEGYGYAAVADLEQLKDVPEFLRRSGLSYADLLALLETAFVNPDQVTLDFLNQLFATTTLDPASRWDRLKRIESGALDPAADPELSQALDDYNDAHEAALTPEEFADWVTAHLAEFRGVITLHQAAAQCDLTTTTLQTIESIYDNLAESGIDEARWDRIGRFIRLWRRLGWSMHETDLMLAALGESTITARTVELLESVVAIRAATRLPLDQLAALWGNIDIVGEKSLYTSLFLSRAQQPIDPAFTANAWGQYLTRGGTLEAHRPAILSAFRISEEDLTAILATAQIVDGGGPRTLLPADRLDLPNLSTIGRYAILARALKLKAPDLCRLVRLLGVAPFGRWNATLGQYDPPAPARTLEFIELAQRTRELGFKPAVLEYLLTGSAPTESSIGLKPEAARAAARGITDDLRAIESAYPGNVPVPLSAEALLATLTQLFPADIATRLVEILSGSALFTTITDHNLDLEFPAPLDQRCRYVKGSGRLTLTGVMSEADRATLTAIPGVPATLVAAVDRLFLEPAAFLETNFSTLFPDLAEARRLLLDRPAQARPLSPEERFAVVYRAALPLLKGKLRRDTVIQRVAGMLGLNLETTTALIADDIGTITASLASGGFSATYYNNSTWTVDGETRSQVDRQLDFDWGRKSPVTAASFSVDWVGLLSAPNSGTYTLQVEVAEADEKLELSLDGESLLSFPTADGKTALEVEVPLTAGVLRRLRVQYAQLANRASVRLRWRTEASGLEVIPAASVYPAAEFEAFGTLAVRYHRAARLIQGFELEASEVSQLIASKVDFDNLDFTAPTPAAWRRLAGYVTLRKAVPQAQAYLIDVFALASREPAPTVDALRALVGKATAWDATDLAFLFGRLGLGVADLKNEVALGRILPVIRLAGQTGVAPSTLAAWGTAETDFDRLNDTAQLLQGAVRSRYQESEWLTVAPGLSNPLRENRRDALIAYLLSRPSIRNAGITDADGLYEYFLIDVKMGKCMDTSRIVQAHAAIQLFVDRCLLNLESQLDGAGRQVGVPPSAISRNRYQWMQYYRLWEVNRRMIGETASFLEPEWRADRSEPFRELESFLTQNDITDQSVEAGTRAYLAAITETANLEVCAMYQEYQGGNPTVLHVFGRTHAAPYKFFHRRRLASGRWTWWEKVPVDLRVVENGTGSGVHLIPVLWKQRLFLFSPEFRKSSQKKYDSGRTASDVGNNARLSDVEPYPMFQIHMAWTEYAAGRWTPKQCTKEFAEVMQGSIILPREGELTFATRIDAEERLTIAGWTTESSPEIFSFTWPDITSPPAVSSLGIHWLEGGKVFGDYQVAFQRRRKRSQEVAPMTLTLADDTYLATAPEHELLGPSHLSAAEFGAPPGVASPFFYRDPERTYFVRPVPISVTRLLQAPMELPPMVLASTAFKLGSGVPKSAAVAAGATVMRHANGGNAAAAVHVGAGQAAGPQFALGRSDRGAWVYGARVGKPFLTPGLTNYTPTRHYQYVTSDTGLEFHTFHHPYVNDFVRLLNERGLAGLFESDSLLDSDEGASFEARYQPNFDQGFVQKPADFPRRTYYKENVCFDPLGANSLPNAELLHFLPIYVATRLSQNGRYEEAMKWFHYVFHPTTDEPPPAGLPAGARCWKYLPFRVNPGESLNQWLLSLGPNGDPAVEDALITEWRDNPFQPHLIAGRNPLAYMQHVFIKYVENLLAFGDSLYRQFTRETVNLAREKYALALHVLGPEPELIPPREAVRAETYDSLQARWDDFSNAVVAVENLFPTSGDISLSLPSPGASMLGAGQGLYFCLPPNERLLGLWRTVKQRIFNIEHCRDIDGIERELALFAPRIDPAALLNALAQGLTVGDILADLASPLPIYRFNVLLQKAQEFCGEVKALGAAMLATMEKKDGEELGRLRAAHETQLLELITAVRERQLLDARVFREGLEKTRATAELRLRHYAALLDESRNPPGRGSLPSPLTADSQLPPDTVIPEIAVGVDEAVVAGEDAGIKLIKKEKEELEKTEDARHWQIAGQSLELAAAVSHALPNIVIHGTPIGVGSAAAWGGTNLGNALGAAGKALDFVSGFRTYEAQKAARTAGFIRRQQEWAFQANLAAREITQLDKQLTSADIRIQVAEQELANHQQQIENSRAIALYLQTKFTGQELYQWMKEQLYTVYRQGYNLAYDLARRAEKAACLELGCEDSSFVQYGYWDSGRQGLAAGERLGIALRQLEHAYLGTNRRELELTKRIHLSQLDPDALLELRETGKCRFRVTEEQYDLDFRGHYFRRIKCVTLDVPVVAPSVNATLRLLSNTIRTTTAPNAGGSYEHENEDGVWIDDERFRTNYVVTTAIATSTGVNDAGLFELNFRDERYLPFELAGAISDWELELCTDPRLRQFDPRELTEVVLTIRYTAREQGGQFQDQALTYITAWLEGEAGPLVQFLDLRHEYPSEWERLLHPAVAGADQVLDFTVGELRLPYLVHGRTVVVTGFELFARGAPGTAYAPTMRHVDRAGEPVASAALALKGHPRYQELQWLPVGNAEYGQDLTELDIEQPLRIAFGPDQARGITDLYLLLRYRLED